MVESFHAYPNFYTTVVDRLEDQCVILLNFYYFSPYFFNFYKNYVSFTWKNVEKNKTD